MLKYPNIDPVIFNIWGPLKLRWYSLGYMMGIFFAAYYIARELKKKNITHDNLFDDLITYLTIGIIVGGRIFYVLFYNISYYIENPSKALYLWDGGMSFHGGLIGVIVAMIILGKRKKIPIGNILDLGVISSGVGLFSVRVANFINGELYGRHSKVWCSMIFPDDSLGLPRHPSQLYEAMGEGLLIFIILFVLYKKSDIFKIKWALSGLFLIFYGAIRFLIEFTREPDQQIGFLLEYFTIGQLFCFIMVISGIIMIFYALWANKKNKLKIL